jgi:RNA ligase
MEFQHFPKIARLNRLLTITEKIDGTNAAVVIELFPPDALLPELGEVCAVHDPDTDGFFRVMAQSRNRFITPGDDNYGFARWVWDNATELVVALGEGRHFGEWFGSGIQRGYNLAPGEKRFALFNTSRWMDSFISGDFDGVPGLTLVPVLYEGLPYLEVVEDALEDLRTSGSLVSNFDRPEGIVIYHHAAKTLFKVTLENDEAPKSQVG